MTHDPRLGAYICLVRKFGLGFHPDTRARDYIDDDGLPTYATDEEADMHDFIVQTAFRLCDPYEVAIEVWEDMGLN
jgi:hypothetical protein